MKFHPLTALLLAGLLLQTPGLFAQEPATQPAEEQEMKHLPQWLVDFSNLSAETRKQYINTFNHAKLAYQKNEWIECITLLAECEVILRGNPNIWNLRACCLLEQKYFAEAESETKRALKLNPSDPIAIMNMASVHMVYGRYAESLAIITRLREDLYLQECEEEVLYALDFRALLCHLMMGNMSEAKSIATSVSPMADTPLYHYAKAAIALVEGNRTTAAHNLNIVKQIFANNQAFLPYERTLALSGLVEKTTSPQPETR